MDFREREPLGNIPVNPKKTLEVLECTLVEFKDFVSAKVNEERKEMVFKQSEDIAWAYFEEEETLYVRIEDNPDSSGSDGNEDGSKKNKGSIFGKSSLFTKGTLIFLLILSSFMPQTTYAAGYFSGNMSEDSTNYTGLSNAKFTTPSGSLKVPGYLSIVKSKIYQDTAFTYTNPNRVKNQPSVNLDSLPDGSNENLLVALLSYRQKFSLSEIATSTGINANQRQLDEATQLAIWLQGANVQVEYQIDANSINDSVVRALATEITTWAIQQVNSLSDDMTMGTYLFPIYQPTVDASKAKVTKLNGAVEYGPYTLSGQKSAKMLYEVPGGLIVDSSKKKLDLVTANQDFYVRYPSVYTGSKTIMLKGQQFEYSLNYGLNRLWLDKSPKDITANFSVGGTTGTNGLIQINAKDSLTGKPVSGVGVDVSTTSPLTTVNTDNKGSASYETGVGTYRLTYKVPEGYVAPKDQEVTISFAGDIQTINLNLSWSKSVVNFYAVDSQTLKPSGDSEAFIYDSSGKAVKRVAITKGKVKGVVLPEGEYSIVQYKSSDGYAINTGTPFKAVAGKVQDFTINQDPNTLDTTVSIDGASSGDSWVYTFSTDNKVLFKLNSSNTLSVPLPSGKYSVLAQKSDGTVTAGPLNFTTVLNGKTDVTLTQEKGTESVTFSIVDTIKNQPIPNVVLGVFDENHNLLTYTTADSKGSVTFNNLMKYSIYYVNVIAAPDSVSGYSANGNKFMAQTRSYELQLYSLAEIQEVTKVDTLYRVPNVTYTGASYTYPKGGS